MEDWAEIRRLHQAEVLPVKMIARTLGVSRNTVRAALAADGPPRYVRKPVGSAVDVFEPRIREQLQRSPWQASSANARKMRVLGCTPGDRVDADRAAMLPLPPVPPEVGWRKTLRLPRDHYVRVDLHDYSVHPAVIGRRIEIHADLERVWVTCEGAIVADHARVWTRHQTITEFEHTVAARHLRHGRADLLRPVADAVTGEEIEIRSLGFHDLALGLVDEDVS